MVNHRSPKAELGVRFPPPLPMPETKEELNQKESQEELIPARLFGFEEPLTFEDKDEGSYKPIFLPPDIPKGSVISMPTSSEDQENSYFRVVNRKRVYQRISYILQRVKKPSPDASEKIIHISSPKTGVLEST